MKNKILLIAILVFITMLGSAQTAQRPNPITPNGDTLVHLQDVMPEFQGGESAFMNYLSKNVRYLQSAKENG